MLVNIYIGVFVVSLLVIVALFSLSYAEYRAGRHYAVPARRSLDALALRIRRFLKLIAYIIEHLPVLSVRAFYFTLHIFAVAVGLAARATEQWARRLSDTVSHKRDFERRPTRSSFLRQVRHHKETLQVPEEVWKDDRES